MSKQAGLGEAQTEGFLEKFTAETPLRCNRDPNEIASGATFLASSETCFITGVELEVDGGYAQV
jgi:NAD(P)-dependent dehydrogenase (short-subunit alcohol dehydrogenase family)